MKMRASTAFYVAGAAVAAGLLILGTSWAQEAQPVKTKRPTSGVFMKKFGDQPFGFRQKLDVLIHNPEMMGDIREAAERLRDAEGDEARETAKDELSKRLDEFFENDMQRRADELAKIEERVKKLHALMERRAAKKQEIIDLQIRVLENEADGLGFFGDRMGPPHDPWMMAPGVRVEEGNRVIYAPDFQVPPPPAPPRAGEAPRSRHPEPPVNPPR